MFFFLNKDYEMTISSFFAGGGGEKRRRTPKFILLCNMQSWKKVSKLENIY